MSVEGYLAASASETGVLAILMALKASCSVFGLWPQPSRTIRITGLLGCSDIDKYSVWVVIF